MNEKQNEKPKVLVVSCTSDFPISSKKDRKRNLISTVRKDGKDVNHDPERTHPDSKTKLLDWSQTAREIHKLGATGFVGKLKRAHEDEQYELLTGRKKKKQKMPLPLIRTLRKKAREKEAIEMKEAKEAGIIAPKSAKTETKSGRGNKNKDKNFLIHGPSPSIGFMKNGIYRVSKNSKP